MQRFIYIFLFSAIFLNSLSANDKNIDICSLSFPSFSHTVAKLLPTVVNISTSKSITKKGVDLPDLLPELPENSPFEFFFKDLFGSGIIADKVETVTSLGSGFIISEDGYIVTNNHVLDSAEIVDVKLNDGQIVRARIIGRDIKSDLALLKIKTKDKLPFIEVGDSDNSAVGDWVIAVGNPFGLGGTVT
ncbi:MAG: trypsin-like serine protease, partial [Alphaproteobacteria bacterium]|nr:trypsin-like serine protease [Alphaproteobacteria bacterium]